jgi:hypothetical protein
VDLLNLSLAKAFGFSSGFLCSAVAEECGVSLVQPGMGYV